MQPALPNVLTPTQRFEDTLMILSITANRNYHLLSNCIRVYDSRSGSPTEPEMALIKGIQMFGVIQFSAFLDEWNHQFIKLRIDGYEVTRIEKVERLAQPAFDVINLYPDIKALRDSVFAHNSRVRINRQLLNSFRGNHIANFVVPASISEFMLLATACLEIVKIAVTEFNEYHIESTDFLTRFMAPIINQARSNNECLTLHNSIFENIERLRML